MKMPLSCFFIITIVLLTLSLNSFSKEILFSINKHVASNAKVYVSFDKNEGAKINSKETDPYGTYLSGFPSMNDHGDVSGRTAFTYIDPNSGEEVTQWEASVWIAGEIHRLGVYYCVSAKCQSRAMKMNNSRDIIVGSTHGVLAATSPYYERAIEWTSRSGEWISGFGRLDNSIQSYIEDVNDQGSLLGTALIALDYYPHAQSIINGRKVTLGKINTQSRGSAINNSNDIVGSVYEGDGEYAFHWRYGTNTDSLNHLPSLNGHSTVAYDINDVDVIVGKATNSNGQSRAVKWVDSTIIELGTLGGETSIARSVNNDFTIVGYAATSTGKNHAFVHIDGVMMDLNDMANVDEGWVIVDAYTVNENGQILVRAQLGESVVEKDNVYWVLSPKTFIAQEGPEFLADFGYCHWGQTDCEISYPPERINNIYYQLPAGPMPVFPIAKIPAADVYVCNTHCDEYASLAPQFETINEALNNSYANNTIIVLPGVYHESVAYGSRKLMGLTREYTIITAENTNKRGVKLNGNAEIHNIAITGGSALNGGGIQVANGGNLINNCIIQGNSASRDGGGVQGLMYSSFTLANSIISQNKATYGGGYISWAYSNTEVRNNEFLNNKASYGAGVFYSSYANTKFQSNKVNGNHASRSGGGIYVNSYTNDPYIRNSLITNNSAGKYAGGVYRGALLGSIVYGNKAEVAIYSAIVLTTSNNSIIWGNAGATSRGGINDSIIQGGVGNCNYCSNVINKDPLFVDSENGNFRLREGSPAIDAGADTSYVYGQWQTYDFNGIPRGIDGDGNGISTGNDFDIGAFEYSPL